MVPADELIVVYPATPAVPCGALQPDGTATDNSPLSMVSVAVKVNVCVFPVEFASVEVGVTVLVPDPSAALRLWTTAKNAVRLMRATLHAPMI